MSISVFPEHELEAVYGPLRRVVGVKRESWNRWSVFLQCGHAVPRHVTTATHMQRQLAGGDDVFARCPHCTGQGYRASSELFSAKENT